MRGEQDSAAKDGAYGRKSNGRCGTKYEAHNNREQRRVNTGSFECLTDGFDAVAWGDSAVGTAVEARKRRESRGARVVAPG